MYSDGMTGTTFEFRLKLKYSLRDSDYEVEDEDEQVNISNGALLHPVDPHMHLGGAGIARDAA